MKAHEDNSPLPELYLQTRRPKSMSCQKTASAGHRHLREYLHARMVDGCFEGVEKLRLAQVSDPQPGPGEALLRMRFAALNPADAFLAKAQYPAKPPLPHILGRDGVGDVLAVGAGVSNVAVGDTVGILRCDVGVDTWGTLAEKTVVCAASLAKIPGGWSMEEMAGAPLTFLTAWQALTQWSDPPAPPPAGSTLLVTGASGGVGVASVLLGKSMGLTIVALSRSAEKAAKLKELGADFVFDPADANLRKSVTAAIAPKKIDLAIDNVAGPLFNQVIALLGYGGRISVVGRSGGARSRFQYRHALLPPQPHRRRRRRRFHPRIGPGNVERDPRPSRRDRQTASGGRRLSIRRSQAGFRAPESRPDGQGAGAGGRISGE